MTITKQKKDRERERDVRNVAFFLSLCVARVCVTKE